MKKRKKIIIGMSGGVDSAVATYLLKQAGYKVEGVFLEFWKSEKNEREFKSAQKIARILNVEIYKIDAQKEFKKKIVDKFIEKYRHGRTPNPCVVCNPQMKFNLLLKEMKKRKADFVATGHYVRIKRKFLIFNFKFLNNFQFLISKFQKWRLIQPSLQESICLLKAKDKLKDQSYFLYGLRSRQLKKMKFPLGNLLKDEVKNIAREMNLGVADKKESQDICFIADNNINKFLKEHIEDRSGEIQSISGKALGKHKGLHFYTIGQRRGIDLGGNGPYYVVRKDIENNILIVSNNTNDKNLFAKKITVFDVNLINKRLRFPLRVMIKIRYGSKEVCGRIKSLEYENSKSTEQFEVEFDDKQKAVTSGQAAVFYSEEGEILGGGTIM